jgi:hypothetical protein
MRRGLLVLHISCSSHIDKQMAAMTTSTTQTSGHRNDTKPLGRKDRPLLLLHFLPTSRSSISEIIPSSFFLLVENGNSISLVLSLWWLLVSPLLVRWLRRITRWRCGRATKRWTRLASAPRISRRVSVLVPFKRGGTTPRRPTQDPVEALPSTPSRTPQAFPAAMTTSRRDDVMMIASDLAVGGCRGHHWLRRCCRSDDTTTNHHRRRNVFV